MSMKTRIVAGALGAVALVGGATGLAAFTGPDAQADQTAAESELVADVQKDSVTTQNTLSADAAMRAAQAALEAAADKGERVTVAVVDRDGNTVALVQGDGAGPQTPESAERKAFTAVSFGKPTSDLVEGATGDGPTIKDIPGTLFLAGGVPVTSDEAPIAGIGVGGAPSGDIDQEIAQAGLEAIR